MRKIFYTFCLISALSPAQMLAYTPAGLDPLPTFGSVIYQVLGGTWSAAMERFSLQWWDASQDTAENQGSVLAVTPTPTGNPIQSFCDAATVADLVAIPDTGGMIDWYDAATGGNLLNATDVLADGDLVFAEQTIGGVPSADRLQVLVHFIDVDIAASSTTICLGDSVDLTALFDGPAIPNSSYLGYLGPKLVYLHSPNKTWPAAESFAISFNGHLLSLHSQTELDFTLAQTNVTAWIGLSDRNVIGLYEWSDESALDYTNFLPGEPNGASFNSYVKQFTSGFWDDVPITRLHPSFFQLDQVNLSYEWSTTETTEVINVSPIETTDYWVDVTLNGVICRKTITVTVIPTPTPGITNNTGGA
ncbi:MAG: lectin-like protein, partial [Flavobacteriaceae bacterium]